MKTKQLKVGLLVMVLWAAVMLPAIYAATAAPEPTNFTLLQQAQIQTAGAELDLAVAAQLHYNGDIGGARRMASSAAGRLAVAQDLIRVYTEGRRSE